MPVRAALFSYFELDDLTRLMNAISGSEVPAGTRVHIGTYGVNREASTTVHTYAPGRYSPMFKAEVRTEAWEQRRLTPEEEREVSRRFSGPVPDEAALLGLSAAQRTAWGVEVGRRYREHDPPLSRRRDHGRLVAAGRARDAARGVAGKAAPRVRSRCPRG
jgi:hypothetical protein